MRILTMLLPVALLLPSVSAQKINDAILKKDGSRMRGVEITEFLLSGVRGKRGNDDFEVPAYQIIDVEWSGLPEEVLAARAAMGRGDFEAATQLFGAVPGEPHSGCSMCGRHFSPISHLRRGAHTRDGCA